MKSRISSMFLVVLSLILIASMVLSGCQTAEAPVAQAPAAEAPAAEAPAAEAPAAAEPVVNRAGVVLPADAAPIEEQVLELAVEDSKWLGWDTSVYDSVTSATYGLLDSCVRPDREFNPQPNVCSEWSVSEDGLTWTFKIQEDRNWNDGTPVTAQDAVFTLQRYTRPDYDFEWFYSMANITNWGSVVSGEMTFDDLGAKVVDDKTFTVTTTQPTPYLVKLFADLWIVPSHLVKDPWDDGTWSLDPANQKIGCGPYVLESWNTGKDITWIANEKYNGPFPPMMDKIHLTFMDPEVRFNAYLNGEIDSLGHLFGGDLTPSSLAQIKADPELSKQLITWPNFQTFYLFFDTWNEPFDDIKVRQAFGHAIDRNAIVNGPLAYQSAEAVSMNPPGFPGANVDALKDVQAYDPELAKKLMEEAGYPNGAGFPELVLYTRNASPAITNAAELVVSMLKENLGVIAVVQNYDYSIYSENLRNQKKTMGGDFKFALVPYEFDFVDGSNMLGVWGGCETEGAAMSDMPGRHTWYNQEFNTLLCEAGAVMNDEPKRNEMYQQAEKILIEDFAMVPIWHSVWNVMMKPDIAGPALEPNAEGNVTFWRMKYNTSEGQVYRVKAAE